MRKNYFIIILVLGFCSCQKELSQPDEPDAEVDVYVAGYTSDDANSPYPVYNPYQTRDEHPTYWKNGSPVQLDYADFFATDFKSGRARAIAAKRRYPA